MVLCACFDSCITGLRDRLNNGGNVVVAEGYLLELERRGHLQAGAFIPEVVLEHPEVVKALHEEFVHAGSDVVVAFTVRMRFYGVKNNIHCNVRKFTCNTALGSCAEEDHSGIIYATQHR